MKTTFEKGGKPQVIVLEDAKKEAELWGKRLIKQTDLSYNNMWSFAWYPPAAWSTPHYHERSESIYYFDFQGKPGNVKMLLGWPLSQADVTEITGPTILYIPAFETHCFANCGDSEMFLLHTFSPPWKDTGSEMDVVDAETGERFTEAAHYIEHVAEGDKKYGTLEGYIEHLKEVGKY